jgi:predicted ATP-grasp superfamily ATP-dependent carboligase
VPDGTRAVERDIPQRAGPRAGPDGRPVAVVAKCGWVNGLAAIRALGRRGVTVIALDYDAAALGFESRYAAPARCPDPLEDEAAFVAFMSKLGDSLEHPAPIFPTNDELLNAIGRHQETLGDRFLYPFPSWDLLGPIQTKRFQVERARALGVPHPRTSYEPTDELGFPVLVKPSDPAPFQRAFRAHSFRCETLDELEAAYERARPYDPLVQEFIPGGDDALYTLGAYVSAQGDALGLFSGRKLRQTPPGAGTCRVGESVWVDEVVEHGRRYLEGLGFHGLAQVEFKRDERDGEYKLMEINPRLWQWHGLAAACGVDLVDVAYRDLLGEPVEPKLKSRSGLRWAITLAPSESPAFVRPPYVDAVFARDDPRPGRVHVRRVLAAGRVARLVRRVRRRARLALAGLGARKENVPQSR